MSEVKRRHLAKFKPESEQVIETIRFLLRTDTPKWQIKQLISSKWGLKFRRIEDYISLARERNAQLLDLTEDEITAETLDYWGTALQNAEKIVRDMGKRLEKIGKDIETQRELWEDLTAPLEHREMAAQKIDLLIRDQDHVRRMVYNARMESKEAKREIQKIRGTKAPERMALTDSKGRDVLRAAPPQALTHEDGDKLLAALLDKVTERAKLGDLNGHAK